MYQPVLSLLQAADTVVNDVDIGQGQLQDSVNYMDRITTESTTETTTDTTTYTTDLTTLQIPIAVSVSYLN